ncbi:alpha/beta hydrolase-fold protein [Kribbella sp. NBC_00889]|uniref:alpha/beta hydrolase-fold protein n=1 Tax=Kribbella sp. NBC_00889 TaxID=2975974 RepID=UPI003867CC25|nr:alpha/beta hydrolase-fold protein [Kribbella sp. NBC_00889]
MTISVQPDLRSPALRTFVADSAADQAAALQRLRDELSASGGPLIEEDGSGATLVTFVYIGPAAESVAVDSHAVMSRDTGDRALMTQVPGTEVWYQSIVTEYDELEVSYRFLVDSRTALFNVEQIESSTRTAESLNAYALDRQLAFRDDPFNQDRMMLDGKQLFEENRAVLGDATDLVRWENILTLPKGRTNQALIARARTRETTLTEHRIWSETFGDERTVSVHVPSDQYDGPYSVFFLLDGPGGIALGLPALMDELTERGEIRPTVTVYVHNKDFWSRSVEMVCNPQLVDQYAGELLPWVREHYDVSESAADVAVSGGSYGGLGSSWLAYSRPDLFGNVLSMSGSYWWGMKGAWGNNDADSTVYGIEDEPEWLTRQFAAAERSAVRFYIAAGKLESQHLDGGISLLAANRHLRTVLQAKGYDVHFDEYHGGHDRAGWRGALIAGLRYLLPAR